MMDFLATNFNLPTIIGAVIVFGGTGPDCVALSQAWRRWLRLRWQLPR